MPLLNRKAQVVVAIEGTEGTGATMAADDGKMPVYDLVFSDRPELFDRNPSRSTLSRLAKVVGKEGAGVSFKTELKGSGSLTTRPSWDKAIRCCGFSSAVVSGITVSGMTGTFYPGEGFTTSSGGKKGRVVGRHNGATQLYYAPTSGALTSGATIVGDVSGAQCIAAGSPATNKGFEYRPISASDPSATVGTYRDGTLKKAAGSRGNVRVEAEAGQPAFLAFEFDGVYEGVSDASMLTVTYESTVPPAFKSATTYADGLQVVFTKLSLDMKNTLTPRENAASAKGILSVKVTDRDPQISIDPEMVLTATKDLHGALHAGSTGYFSSEWGSVAGNRIRLGSPRVQYEGVDEGERGGIATVPIIFGCKAASASTGDDEVQIAVL